ncbi:UNVERIFIED_CONTAM: SpoVG family protein [Kocuria sp. CPCC 205274]|uniref:SpoVG family protein n=1 Tax=Herbiconiux daphne TaxID=2970914 RepID=A0ABT2H937_9MICO|nr:SpoVG family protein [Herbiconiux daphne]MCS5736446.1 SpoVG family protein [Herbiconiux daphne]
MDYKTSFKHEGVTYDVEITFREYVKGKLKGFVNASFKKGDEIYLVANDLQVVEGTKGHFISEPKK